MISFTMHVVNSSELYSNGPKVLQMYSFQLLKRSLFPENFIANYATSGNSWLIFILLVELTMNFYNLWIQNLRCKLSVIALFLVIFKVLTRLFFECFLLMFYAFKFSRFFLRLVVNKTFNLNNLPTIKNK